MAVTEAELLERLRGLGIAAPTVRHPPVFTVEENKALRGALPGAHAKNLFLKDKKGQLWLVVAEEDRAVDLKDLRRRIGAGQLSFARPEVLRDVLGIEPGAVTPLAVVNDAGNRVRVVLDAALADAPVLNFHPLTNTATTALSAAELCRFLESTGHPPLLAELDPAAAGAA